MGSTSVVGAVKKLDEWVKGTGISIENGLRKWNGTAIEKKKKVLWFSVIFSFWPIWTLPYLSKAHHSWFLIPLLAPLCTAMVGNLVIDVIHDSNLQYEHSYSLELIFFLISVALSLSIGFTGMGGFLLVLNGCVYILWASLVDIIFDLATPTGLVGCFVSATISFVIATDGKFDALVTLPIILGALLTWFTRRFGKALFSNSDGPDAMHPYQTRIAELEEALTVLQNQVAVNEEKIESKDISMQEMRQEIDSHKKTAREHQNQIRVYEREIRNQIQKTAASEENVENLNNAIHIQEKATAEREEKMQEDIKEKESVIVSQEGKIQKAEEKIEEFQQSLTMLGTEVYDIQQDLTDLELHVLYLEYLELLFRDIH